MDSFISDIPFDKVTIIDKDGNRQEITAHKIIIEAGANEFHLENLSHPAAPKGITISCSKYDEDDDFFETLAIHPGASNVIHLDIIEHKRKKS
ncbi:hypothetical protein ACQWU4_05055 [Chryseobacterium sp. MIQD13]|uniref:hypothetical protein n=1 Tax=Chryseobacterium sp. MIQD13 TaxID=3422310 RepID=UPI003D28FF68